MLKRNKESKNDYSLVHKDKLLICMLKNIWQKRLIVLRKQSKGVKPLNMVLPINLASIFYFKQFHNSVTLKRNKEIKNYYSLALKDKLLICM